jgi:hypothetical protein
MDRRAIDGFDRERSATEVLAKTFELYGRYPLLFPALAAGVVIPYVLIVYLVTGDAPYGHQHLGVLAGLFLPLSQVALIRPLVSALHVHAVQDVTEGGDPRFGSVVRRGLVVLPVVTVAVVVAWVGTMLGLILLIVPGVLLWLRWVVVAQVAALEGGSWTDALKRSADLTERNYLHIIGVSILSLLATGVPSFLIGVPLRHTHTTVATFAAGTAIQILVFSFGALNTAVLYFDLEARLRASVEKALGKTAPPEAKPPSSSSGRVVEPTGHPLDPTSYSDEDRPAGWYVIPETPWSMRYWAADGKGEWSSRKAKTPKDVREGWRDTRWIRDPAPGDESA